MIKVVGIRFQRAGKIYYFDPLDYDLETAMHVIVETARGVEMGTVLIPPKEVDASVSDLFMIQLSASLFNYSGSTGAVPLASAASRYS